ncbi:MAG: desulfoferrodoxin [Desulfobacteraceae bacterium 4572_130]|nr:MAG: desulfoferrodoxin [Desulfobacteraceae bacterium 4572_130]
MTQKNEVYKCKVCGNIVEILHQGKGTLKCCGASMSLLTENTVDAAQEKHVPKIEKIDGGVKISVGEIAHPMEEKHYIEWIEIIAGEKTSKQFLKSNQDPEAVFFTDDSNVTARAYCNLHGHWKS